MHYLAAASIGSTAFRLTFGDWVTLFALVLIVVAGVCESKVNNKILSFVLSLGLTLFAGILVAAAYPHQLLTPLYHMSGGKIGIP